MARATAVMKALKRLLSGGEKALPMTDLDHRGMEMGYARTIKDSRGRGAYNAASAEMDTIPTRYREGAMARINAVEPDGGAGISKTMPKRIGNADPISAVPPQADDVYFDNPTKAAGEFAGRSGSFGTPQERALYGLMHDNPQASDEQLAQALGVPLNILNILKRKLGAGGFDIQNRGRPETGGPMDRGEF